MSRKRIDYKIDKSNYKEWKLYGMKCTQVSTIRVHASHDFAPYMDFSCIKASGNNNIGILPNQWVEIKIRNGGWSLLAEADRRP